MPLHQITRMKRDVVRRQLTVQSKQWITPRMLRIVFHSTELEGFDSPSPDDHIKIFLPGPVMRDFTPRAWNAAAGTLTLDFAMHANGPAVDWANQAQAGDLLSIGGPRGSTIVADDFDWYLLIGDATALPSIGRRLESLRPDVSVTVIALVANFAERQEFETRASCDLRWLTSAGNVAQDRSMLRAVLEQYQPPAGDGFVWIAGETSIVRELYQHIIGPMKQPKEWVKANGYWSQGTADGGEKIA